MPHLRRTFLLLYGIGLVLFTFVGCDIARSMPRPIVIVIADSLISNQA